MEVIEGGEEGQYGEIGVAAEAVADRASPAPGEEDSGGEEDEEVREAEGDDQLKGLRVGGVSGSHEGGDSLWGREVEHPESMRYENAWASSL